MTAIPPPNGSCFCGCGGSAGVGSYWQEGHEKKAESDMNSIHHGDSVVQRLIDFGYGPGGKNLHDETIRAGTRELCGQPGCSVTAQPGSEVLRRHRARQAGQGQSELRQHSLGLAGKFVAEHLRRT